MSSKFDEMNRDEYRENRGGLKRNMHSYKSRWSRHRRHGRGQKRKASRREEKERSGEERRGVTVEKEGNKCERERGKNVSTYRRGEWNVEERAAGRARDAAKRRRRGEFSANTRFLATVRWRPPLSGKNHAIPPTLFPDIYLPIGCVYQSLAANARRRGFDAAIVAAFAVFPLAKAMSIEFRLGDVADYLIADNSVLG